MILTENGVLKLMQRIKSFITSQLNTKAPSVHTHTISEIDNLASQLGGGGYTKSESDDKFVDKTSDQTITGKKTFRSTPTVKKNGAGDLLYLIDDTINTSNEDENGFPLTGHTNSLKIRGHDSNMIPCMLTGQVFTSGDTSAELRAYKYKDISSDGCFARLSIQYSFANNTAVLSLYNIVQLNPSHTNTANLGSSALQWNNVYTRNILIDNDINIASSLINKTSNSGTISVRGGTYFADGASVILYGKDYNGSHAGAVTINAYGNSDYTNLCIYPNGTMSVYNTSTDTTKKVAMQEDVNTLLSGKANSSHTHTKSEITDFPTIPTKTSDLTNDSCIPLSGTNALVGSIIPSTNISYSLGSTNYRFLEGCFGNLWTGGLFGNADSGIDINYTVGANLILRGKNRPSEAGMFWLVADDGSNSNRMMGSPDGTLTWTGQAIQTVSDQRLKQQISKIDNALLDAWEDVNLVQFKYNDAVEEKGDKARLHTGYVVQQIDTACKSHNVDISEYGLYCHEQYPERTEEVTIENEDGTTTKETKVIEPAKEHYSLRYTEALIVECAFLRREINRLKEQMKK